MKSIILRDDTDHLGEIRDHEEPVFYGVDFGYPEAENIITAQLCQSTGVPKIFDSKPRKRRQHE